MGSIEVFLLLSLLWTRSALQLHCSTFRGTAAQCQRYYTIVLPLLVLPRNASIVQDMLPSVTSCHQRSIHC